MFKRKFKEEFDFHGLMIFIHSLFDSHGFGEIRFYPGSHKELFIENQLTHVAPGWNINNPNGFIFAWRKYKEIVRKVTFDQFSKYESKNRRVRITVDLDKKYISLEKNIGISSEQVEEVLENSFGPDLIDINEDKNALPKEEGVHRKERIGILNKGRHNKFINNKFLGLNVGIQDEGEKTLASGNRFLYRPPPIEKIEIVGRDKIEQHGDKSEASIKKYRRPKKNWFSMDNPIVWLIFTIITIVIGWIIKLLFFPG